jgi:uncharacterized protein YndB with AHSA1/START domain
MATTIIAPITHIAPDNNVVLGEVFIEAPRERVFQAISDPQQTVKWLGQSDKYQFSEFKMDVRVGGKWSCAGSSATMGGRIEVHGEFLEVDPPRKLAYTWSSSWMPTTTEVHWQLESQDSGTLLKLTHSGFAGNADQAKGHSIGWALVLSWVQAFVERGETRAVRS